MASILDVFNASARLISQGADIYSREQKYHLDTELYKQSQDLDMLQNRLAEDLYKPDASGQMPFLNKPDEYRKYVEKSLAEWTRNAVAAGNGSRYYNDNLNRLALQGQTAMGKKMYAAEQVAAQQQMGVDFQARMTAIYNSGETPEVIFSNAVKEAEQYAMYNGTDIAGKDKLVDSVYSDVYNLMLSVDNMRPSKSDDGTYEVYKPSDLDTQIGDIYKAFPGEKPEEHIPGMKEKLEETKALWRKEAEERNYNNFRLQQDAFTLARNQRNLGIAADIAWQNRERQKKAIGSDLYSPEQQAAIAGWFNMPEIDGGSPRESNVDKEMLKEFTKEEIKKVFGGETDYNQYSLREDLVEILENRTMEDLGTGFTPLDRARAHAIATTEFIKLAQEVAWDGDFPVLAGLLDKYKNVTKIQPNVLNKYPEAQIEIDNFVAGYVTDAIMDTDFRRRPDGKTPEKEIETKAQGLIGTLISGAADIIRDFKITGGLGDRDTISYLDAIEYRNSNPDILYTGTTGARQFIPGTGDLQSTEKSLETISSWEAKKIQDISGAGNLEAVYSREKQEPFGVVPHDENTNMIYHETGTPNYYRMVRTGKDSFEIQTRRGEHEDDDAGWTTVGNQAPGALAATRNAAAAERAEDFRQRISGDPVRNSPQIIREIVEDREKYPPPPGYDEHDWNSRSKRMRILDTYGLEKYLDFLGVTYE
jgi:hypothetical protein